MVTVLPLARPGSGGRELLAARPSLRRPGDPGPRPRSRRASSSTASASRWASRAAASPSTPRRSWTALETGRHRVRRRAVPAAARSTIRPRPLASVQGPHVRVGDLAAVDGPHGPPGRRADGHRPEAVGDRRGGAGRRTASASSSSTATEPPKPILCVFAGVSHDPAEAQRMRDVYLQRYARSTVEHYHFDDVGFADIEGYEYYAGLASNIEKHGLEKFNGFLADLQVWGSRPGRRQAARLRPSAPTPAPCSSTLSFGGMSAASRHEPTSTCSPARCCPMLQATTSAATSASPTADRPGGAHRRVAIARDWAADIL